MHTIYIIGPVQSLIKKAPEVQITALALMDAYVTNENSADDLYLDRIVQVSGEIREVQEQNGEINVILDTGNPLSGVICEMESNKYKGLKSGQMVNIKGYCTGYLMDVVLTKCVVLN